MGKIIEEGRFQSTLDIAKLDIIDWNRLNGYWANVAEAMEHIGNTLIDMRATYAVYEGDLKRYPDQGTGPGWTHVGAHAHLGRLYWNTSATAEIDAKAATAQQ